MTTKENITHKTKTSTELVKYSSEQIANARSKYLSEVKTMSMKASSEVVIKAGGISFPIKNIRPDKNKPGPTGKDSYNLLGKVGSFKNAKGVGCYVDPNGKWILMALSLGKNPTGPELSQYPVSIVTGKPIQHLLIHEGDNKIFFTTNEHIMALKPHTILYIVSASARLTLGKPQIQNVTQPDLFSQQSNLYKRKVRTPSYMSLANGDSGRTLTTTCSKENHDVISSSEFSISDFDKLAEIINQTDCSEFYGMSATPEIIAKYRNLHSDMTEGQRICFEYKFPQHIPMNIPSKAIAEGLVPKVIINCGHIIPTQPIQYANQDQEDVILMLREEKIETQIDSDFFADREQSAFILVARTPEEHQAMLEARMLDIPLEKDRKPGEPALERPMLTTFVFQSEKIIGSDGTEKSPLVSRSPYTGIGACIPFTFTISSWPQDKSYMEALELGEIYTINVRGRAYDRHIANAFGITNTVAWVALGPKILETTTMWFTLAVDMFKTRRLPSNSGKTSFSLFETTVESLIADLPTALIKNGLGKKILPEEAVSIINTTISKLKLKNANPGSVYEPLSMPSPASMIGFHIEDLSAVTCITEHPTLFKVAIAAKCDFYAVSAENITYVYAVRSDLQANAYRGKIAMSVYATGGFYDDIGLPLIYAQNVPTDIKPQLCITEPKVSDSENIPTDTELKVSDSENISVGVFSQVSDSEPISKGKCLRSRKRVCRNKPISPHHN